MSKQLRDEVKNYTPVFCGELANSYVFGDSSEDFDSSLSKEALTQIFQLYVTPLVEEMVMDLLYWNFPHIQSPDHRKLLCKEHCPRCGGFHSCEDCQISWEEAKEKWKETRMGRWDGQSSYLPYLQANITDLKSEASDTKGIITDPSLDISGTNLESAKAETSDNKTSRTEPSLNFSASAEGNPNTGTNLSELIPPEQPDHPDF